MNDKDKEEMNDKDKEEINDKDKEEFEKWYSEYFKIEGITIINIPHHFTESWKAACEYKQKEIDILKNHDIAGYEEGIDCLQAENKKLREAFDESILRWQDLDEWNKSPSELEAFDAGWQSACEYMQKEIDILKNHDIAGYKEGIDCLQAENKKLREALEWYADKKNCDNPDFAHVEFDAHGEEIADGGYRAREALKEVGEV